MDIWKRDLVREIMMKQKRLNQMKRLSYDIKYQNGHAMSLESLNKMHRYLKNLGIKSLSDTPPSSLLDSKKPNYVKMRK
jgi:hypothetical protein